MLHVLLYRSTSSEAYGIPELLGGPQWVEYKQHALGGTTASGCSSSSGGRARRRPLWYLLLWHPSTHWLYQHYTVISTSTSTSKATRGKGDPINSHLQADLLSAIWSAACCLGGAPERHLSRPERHLSGTWA